MPMPTPAYALPPMPMSTPAYALHQGAPMVAPYVLMGRPVFAGPVAAAPPPTANHSLFGTVFQRAKQAQVELAMLKDEVKEDEVPTPAAAQAPVRAQIVAVVKTSAVPCAFCFVVLRDKFRECNYCECVRYCSMKCMRAGAEAHAAECVGLQAGRPKRMAQRWLDTGLSPLAFHGDFRKRLARVLLTCYASSRPVVVVEIVDDDTFEGDVVLIRHMRVIGLRAFSFDEAIYRAPEVGHASVQADIATARALHEQSAPVLAGVCVVCYEGAVVSVVRHVAEADSVFTTRNKQLAFEELPNLLEGILVTSAVF
jgi:hypothetical protein